VAVARPPTACFTLSSDLDLKNTADRFCVGTGGTVMAAMHLDVFFIFKNLGFSLKINKKMQLKKSF